MASAAHRENDDSDVSRAHEREPHPVAEGNALDDDFHYSNHGSNVPFADVVKPISAADAAPLELLDDSSESVEAEQKTGCCGVLQRIHANIYRVVRIVIPFGGLLSNSLSLGSLILGGGIISMPSSFATSGIVMASIYLFVINILTIYTIAILGFVMEKTGCRTYETTAAFLFGSKWAYVVGVIFTLSSGGAAIGYVGAVGTLVHPILQSAPGTPDYLRTTNGNRLITTLVWLVCMVPIVLPKKINSLRFFCMCACSMVLYFVATIVIHSSTNGLQLGLRGDMALFTTGNKAIYGISIFIFAFLCHGIVFSVYWEMKPRPSVKGLVLASTVALTACMVMYFLSGFFGYMDFADATKSSVLYNFDPVNQPYIMVAYIGMLLKLCVSFAMVMIPIRNFIYHCIGWELESVPYWKHIPIIIFVASIILICGLFIPNVNLAFGLVGSLCGGFTGFIIPALFWMYCGNWNRQTVGIWHYLATYLMLIIGVIAIVFGTIATIYQSFIEPN